MLNKVYPTKFWYTAVYNGETNSYFSYHSCQDCVSLVNFKNKYNVMAVGVEKTTSANEKLLLSDVWKNNLFTKTTAFDQVWTATQDNCFKGLLSLVGDHNLAYVVPKSPNPYYNLSIKGDNAVLAVANDEPCMWSAKAQVKVQEEKLIQ